ncbi:MAG TPA: DUF1501 domain-containing protein [Gemmataceae bacterium]
MLQLEGKKAVGFCDGLTRRDFLRVGALSAGAVGLSLADYYQLQRAGAAAGSSEVNCILLFLVGGPSHLDTFDLKPDAPDTVRGPFSPIKTNVPGVEICEHFPRMAQMADRYAVLRSVYHKAAPIHETGHQMMQTGYLFRGGQEHPHFGSVISHLKGRKENGAPPFVVVPGPVGNTGVSVSHGQTAGYLGAKHEPFLPRGAAGDCFRITERDCSGTVDPARLNDRWGLIDAVDSVHRAFDVADDSRPRDDASRQAFGLLFAEKTKRAFDIAVEKEELRERYGKNTFGQSCLLARRLVEHGVRFVTVNMFDTVFNEITWDCHADGGSLAVCLDDYKDTLCPMFDGAYSALLDDLKQRGMLDNTLVVAMGEFGRTPLLNPRGGRDHWPGCWSVLFAGANVKGGQVVGASDRTGAEPKDRPVNPPELAATIYKAMGLNLNVRLPGPQNQPMPLVGAAPVHELLHG